jgi:mycofactocin precursor
MAPSDREAGSSSRLGKEDTDPQEIASVVASEEEPEMVEEELLVEDVSIDGMCGVY